MTKCATKWRTSGRSSRGTRRNEMIHVKRERVQVPAILITPDGEGLNERGEAIAFFSDPDNHQKSFKFKVYSHDSVKNALNELFHFKCAYCESFCGATQPLEVEHFRPKSGVVVHGRLRK